MKAIYSLLLLATSVYVQAAPNTWNLQNVTFDDGGTATGSFAYDADTNTLSDWNITTNPGGGPFHLTVKTYTTLNSSPISAPQTPGAFNTQWWVVLESTEFVHPINPALNATLRIGTLSSLTNAGGSVALQLNDNSGECYECSRFRAFASGELIAQLVVAPELVVVSELGVIAPAPVELPGITVQANATTLRESTSTTMPTIQRSGTAENVVQVTREIQTRFREAGARRIPGREKRSSSRVGLSAGDGEQSPWSLWASTSGARIQDSGASTAFKSKLGKLLVGVDGLLGEDLLLGAMLSYGRHDVDTYFNAGQQDIDIYQSGLYVGYLISEHFSIDGALGLGTVHVDQSRSQPLSGLVHSSLQGWRGFMTVNANTFTEIGQFAVDLSAGVLLVHDRYEAFTESNGLHNPRSTVRLGQWRAGVNLSFPIGSVEWFGNAFYAHDFHRTDIRVSANQTPPSGDRSEIQLSTGLRYIHDEQFSMMLEYSTVRGRKSLRSEGIALSARLEF